MTKENRFEGLMDVVGKNKKAQTSKRPDVQNLSREKQPSSKSDVSTSKHTDTQTSKKAKSANPDYTRTTVYLPKKIHKKLKAIALDEEKEMSSIVEELIENWLSSRGKDV